MRKIILASASPRRRELLEQIGYVFEVVTSEKEEVYKNTNPQEIVKELALLKAKDVAEKVAAERGADCERVIIGADTVVVYQGKILGKPKDEAEAARMLEALQGNTHDVYTGVVIICYDREGKEEVISHAVDTKVHVDIMTEEEIQSYIATGEPMDKAGAYGIQGKFAAHITGIEGDYYNVVGLPVSYVYKVLQEKSVK